MGGLQNVPIVVDHDDARTANKIVTGHIQPPLASLTEFYLFSMGIFP